VRLQSGCCPAGCERRQESEWLFVGHDDAGAVNATFTSLLASCRLCDVEPWVYLRDILCLLPTWPEHRLLELAPVNWKTCRDSDDVRARRGQSAPSSYFRPTNLGAAGDGVRRTDTLIRGIEEAKRALELHRGTSPRGSSVDFTRSVVSALDAGKILTGSSSATNQQA
jgi:hypothetical protein